MARHQGLKTALFGFSLGSVMSLMGCASTVPKWESFVAPAPGSSWTQVQRNTGSFGSGTTEVLVRVGEANLDGRKVATRETKAGNILMDTDGAWLGLTNPAGQVQVRFDPPIGYQWPLTVGKTWTKDYTTTVAGSGQKIPFSATWKVEAYEDVTVPAGTFKSWRVSYSDTGGTTQMLWSAPEVGGFVKRVEQRSAAYQPGGAGTRETELLSLTTTK